MEGIDKAAVLLLGIGEDNAASVLKHLETKHVQKIGLAMTGMAKFSKEDIQLVVDDFVAEADKQTRLGIDSDKYIRNVLMRALGKERASRLIDRILTNNEECGLNNLRWMEARNIAALIRHEHPQIVATILTYLDSEQAADVISCFATEQQVDLLLRMSSIDTVKPEALTELSKVIESKLSGLSREQATNKGGQKSVADLMNHLDSQSEAKILEGISSVDSELAEHIKEQMFRFENLSEMDGRSVQTILRDVPNDVLLLALIGADSGVKEVIFSNLSARAADLLRDDLATHGPVKISEVESAQKEILSVARQLAKAGDISLGPRGGEEVV